MQQINVRLDGVIKNVSKKESVRSLWPKVIK